MINKKIQKISTIKIIMKKLKIIMTKLNIIMTKQFKNKLTAKARTSQKIR